MENNVNTAIQDVAGRIRALRESCEVTEEEMAACTDTTVEAYRALEAGESDFTFTFIYKCAQRLGADPTDILKVPVLPSLSTASIAPATDFRSFAARGFIIIIWRPCLKTKLPNPFM